MEAKSLTQKKLKEKVLSSKTDNGEAEVYVLPPDLLQKLGIHLSGVQTSSQQSEYIQSPLSAGFYTSSDVQKADETILETANLMKKSVLLSPTFIPTVSNISGEIEISNICNGFEETNSVGITDVSVTNVESENIDQLTFNSHEIVKSSEVYQNYVPTSLVNGENKQISDTSKMFESMPVKNTNNHENKGVEKLPNDCNEVKILNNIKNSNLEVMKEYNKQINNVSTLDHTNNTTSLGKMYSESLTNVNREIKLNILSEEKLDAPSNVNFTTVPIKTVIQAKTKDGNNYTDEPHEETLKELEPVSLSLESDDLALTNNNISKISKVMKNNFTSPLKFPESVAINKVEKEDLTLRQHPEFITDKDDSNINFDKRNSLQSKIKSDNETLEGNENTYQIQNNDAEKIFHSTNLERQIDDEIVCLYDSNQINQAFHTNTEVPCRNEEIKISKDCNLAQNQILQNGDKSNNEIKEYFDSAIIHMDENNKNTSDKLNDNTVEEVKMTKQISPSVIVKESAVQPNFNSLNSKSCIQGVEKPGGNQSDIDFIYSVPQVLHTYERRSKLLKSTVKISESITPNYNLRLPETFVENFIDSNNVDFTQNQTFCICNDFGKLGNNENCSFYEHIHFSKQMSSDGDEGEIFEKQNISTSSSLETSNNICWINLQREESINNSKTSQFCDTIADANNVNCILNYDIFDIYSEDDTKYEKFFTHEKSLHNIEENQKLSGIVKAELKHLDESCNDTEKTDKNYDIESTLQRNQAVINALDAAIILSDSNMNDSLENVCKATEIEKNKPLRLISEKSDNDKAMKTEKDFDDIDVVNKLKKKINNGGILKCTFCDTKFKKVKLFISHLKCCTNSTKSEEPEPTISNHTQCGVCNNQVDISNWMDHIAEQHNYMAWNDTECILDLQDENQIKEHLQKINKKNNGLICSKCKVVYKYVNSFLKHISKCEVNNDTTENASKSYEHISNDKHDIKKRLRSKNRIDHEELNTSIQSNKSELEKKRDKLIKTQNNETVQTSSIVNNIEPYNKKPYIEIPRHLVVNKTKNVKQFLTHKRKISQNSSIGKVLTPCVDSTNPFTNNKTAKTYKRRLDDKFSNSNPSLDIEKNVENCNESIEMESIPKENNVEMSIVTENGSKDKTEKTNINKSTKRNRKCVSDEANLTSDEEVVIKKPTHMSNVQSRNSQIIDSSDITEEKVKCGVCKMEVSVSLWLDHISKNHNYLAWQDGTEPLDLNMEYEVEYHLKNILKQCGTLRCCKCGCERKYIKPYMTHIKYCRINLTNDKVIDTPIEDVKKEPENTFDKKTDIIKCGVCKQELNCCDWVDHIQKSHNYLAWIEGDNELDLKDAEAVQKHLMPICKKKGGLKCSKCGLVRKYIKSFLQHVKTCGGTEKEDDNCSSFANKDGLIQCGVCSKEMDTNKWKDHAMNEHYNIAWIVGDTPIDLKNIYAVTKYLKAYQDKFDKLICKLCGISRTSGFGFYAHILFCGKTDEETEEYKELCEYCNKQYVCIYKNQHMAMHRDKVFAEERKLKLNAEKEKESSENDIYTGTPGRRKAAEKAKNVIARYKANLNEGNCDKCGFEADNQSELEQHVCMEDDDENLSDASVKSEQYSEVESDDTDIDSDISNDEDEKEMKRTRHGHGEYQSPAAKLSRVPYTVKHVGQYIKKSYEDFCQMHFTSETLFPQWHSCNYALITDEEIPKYTPYLKESCKIKFIDDEWADYKLFEVDSKRGNHMAFVGGIIQCLAWAPIRLAEEKSLDRNYLAVACHSGFECPNHKCDETSEHANLIQIWDFGNTDQTTPKFAFGIAHDYGTVWSMDWCPSGARDLFSIPTDAQPKRLGLLAIACSNGSAYIFAVPYPIETTKKENPFYRMKPVSELRFSMGENKRLCQATSIAWFSQKGHDNIIVGYSDGTIALYDLNIDSPFLKTTEKDVTVIYPYHDERSHNSCITGVGTYLGGMGIGIDKEMARSWSTASFTGARARTGYPGRGATLYTSLASSAAIFTPHWPSVFLTGDSKIGKLNQTVNELEWTGGGRRVGGARSWCACSRCGISASANQPLIRVMHAHPAYPDIKRKIVGVLEMVPIGKKRKHNNDELSIKLEPFDYEDAVKKYGLKFQVVSANNRAAQLNAGPIPCSVNPERYPLADVTCMAFCPSATCHNMLAVGTHSGILIYFRV